MNETPSTASELPLKNFDTFSRNSNVSLQTKVAEILKVWPGLRATLVAGGISGLARPDHDPHPYVTVQYAADRHKVDANALVQRLNDELKKLRAAQP